MKEFYLAQKGHSSAFWNKNKYSYWSRAWTLQEEHLSNTIVYCKISNDEKLTTICKSKDLGTWIQSFFPTVSQYPDFIKEWDKIIGENVLVAFVALVWRMLAGVEKSRLSYCINKKSNSMDAILAYELTKNVRCAQNKHEMNEALCIAFGIYETDIKIQWKRILEVFVVNGMIPVNKCYSLKNNNGWAPGKSTAEKIWDNDESYYSVAFTQFVDTDRDRKMRAVVNDGGSLVIKANRIKVVIKTGVYNTNPVQLSSNLKVPIADGKNRCAGLITIKLAEEQQLELNVVIEYEELIDGEMSSIFFGDKGILLEKAGNRMIGWFLIPPGQHDNELTKWLNEYGNTGYTIIKGTHEQKRDFHD